MILYMSAALGFKVSLKKGRRSTQVEWIGVRFSLVQDNLILGIPEKFTKEVVAMLRGWEGCGMAPVKELRQLAGKISWMSGVFDANKMGCERFLYQRSRSFEKIQKGRRPQQRRAVLAVRQLEQARLAMAYCLLGDSLCQTHEKVQAGHQQVPEGQGDDRCQSRRCC